MNIKFKNGELPYLAQIIHELELDGKASRMRTRLRNAIQTHYNDIVLKEHVYLIELYSTLDDENKQIIPEENKIIFQEALQELMNECFYIECDEANKNMLTVCSKIMLEGNFTTSGEISDMYDLWCEEFEKVLDYYSEE